MIRLEQAIKAIEATTGYKVFTTDIQKDELENNSSFFIYLDESDITTKDNIAYSIGFDLMFISKDRSKLNIFELIMSLRKCGLTFVKSDLEYGQMKNTGVEATMRTIQFSYVKKIVGC